MPAPSPLERWPALVLAAGRGTRMGCPKALMTYRATPWWAWQQERLARAGVEATWVVSETVHAAMISKHDDQPLPRLVRADDSAPMFASILAGINSLELATVAGVFILPVDTPAPTTTDTWAALAGAGTVAIPTCRGARGHPVALPIDWIVSTLLPAAAGADPSTLRLNSLAAPSARLIGVADPAVSINLNTPDDLARLVLP